MSFIRNIDEKLMRLLTCNLWYRDLDKRPQTRIAIMATIAAIGVTVSAIGIVSTASIRYIIPIETAICFLIWLDIVYQWRLWYRLRKRKIGRMNNIQ